MKALVLLAVKGYKIFISPFLPHSCRFYPTCSTYCLQAVEQHGVLRGLYMSVRRIMRCHPFHPGGYDPVEGTETHASLFKLEK
ncbi:MAG: membrane protein insertion efficiency factor YidD [Nitrospira sp.]|nr:membrane protein insertion efficiency factor YidD [bacterium]MBL7050015.1 membrane protein insertion efficiency factor YidD [Nitrospira sp.]